MVTDDRAQLILVGAIAIGIVLIGLTTVLNSAVFTENVAGGSSATVTGGVSEFDRSAVRDVRSLMVRVNHDGVYRDTGTGETELRASAAENVSAYSDVLAETYADTGSVYVNVSFGGATTIGNRVVQRSDANFSEHNGPPTWQPINGPFKLGWFVMNLDAENVSRTTPFYLRLQNSSGVNLNVSIRRTASNQLAVNSSIGGDHTSNVTCAQENGRVLLDVVDGTSYSGDCAFNSTMYLEGPYSSLTVENGESARGKYDLVVNETSPPYPVPNDCGVAPIDRPCKAVAVWSATFTTYYETGSIVHEKTHTVSVYDG